MLYVKKIYIDSYIKVLELLWRENQNYIKFLMQKTPIFVTPDSKYAIELAVVWGKYKSYLSASTWKLSNYYN